MPEDQGQYRLGPLRVQITEEAQAPTLVIVGRHDIITPVSCSQEIVNGIPSAQLEIFEHSGHSPPSDEPIKFEIVLLEWLKSRDLLVVA